MLESVNKVRDFDRLSDLEIRPRACYLDEQTLRAWGMLERGVRDLFADSSRSLTIRN